MVLHQQLKKASVKTMPRTLSRRSKKLAVPSSLSDPSGLQRCLSGLVRDAHQPLPGLNEPVVLALSHKCRRLPTTFVEEYQ